MMKMSLKMKINTIISSFSFAAAALLPLAASGQNLDPTVEVSRAYEGKLMEVHKPQLEMAVPDSVLRFDLDFDYSVTDKPYKGAYEFSPYTVDMRPSPTVYEWKKFRLKAGAGYQPHPVFDMVWTPKFKTDAFRMKVYASHNSFIGNYWKMVQPAPGESVAVMDGIRGDKDAKWHGHDLSTKAGVDGVYDWRNGRLDFGVSYDGIHQSDNALREISRAYNAFEGRLGLASKRNDEGFIYKAGAYYGYGRDAVIDARDGDSGLVVGEFGLNAELGRIFAGGNRFFVEVGFDYASADDGNIYAADDGEIYFMGKHSGADTDIAPHYVIENDRWHVDLGVRLSMAFSNSMYTDVIRSTWPIYPDVRIEFKAVPDAMKIYLDLGGDSGYNSYSDILNYNRRLNQTSVLPSHDLMDISSENINAALGLQGRIGPRFSYDLRGGYVNCDNVLLDGVKYMDASDGLASVFGYGSYQKAFAAADWALDAESFKFDGAVEYSYFIDGPSGLSKGLLLPASLTGDISFAYIWKKRLNLGLDCDFSSAREGQMRVDTPFPSGETVVMPVRVPGYADLGVNVEYAVNRKFSVWARGGNLLNMTVQRSLLYAEKGPYFTAGICLNL